MSAVPAFGRCRPPPFGGVPGAIAVRCPLGKRLRLNAKKFRSLFAGHKSSPAGNSRDGIKSVAKQGAPHEALWPYVIKQFRRKPSKAAYKDARRHPAVLYQRLRQDIQQLRGCLASGFPFTFGFSVYTSFEGDTVARTGRVP